MVPFLYIHREIQKIPDRQDSDMSTFFQVAAASELNNGSMKKIHAGGQDLLLARIRDRYYCTDAYCPHLGGDLSEGTLDGTILTCPLHHSQFDITDGHVLRWTDLTGSILTAAVNQRPPRPLRTYRVEIRSDGVFVER